MITMFTGINSTTKRQAGAIFSTSMIKPFLQKYKILALDKIQI